MPSSDAAPTRRRGGNNHGGANRPLYAIDFTAVACGKRIANTKRRVRWRFGFANPDALAAGETGTACRGEEHDVTLVWSVTSGKRLILADGQEVHYSNSRSAVLDFSWTMRGNHVLKVVAHATAPMSAEPGFRQYDFFVDGRSFFSFPKVYRLGLTGSKTVSPNRGRGGGREAMAESSGRRKVSSNSSNSRAHSGTIAALEAPHNPDEEEAYIREAIKASLESEAKRQQGETTGKAEKPAISAEATDLLIDFMDDFDSTGNTLPPAPAPASSGNEWALAPAPVQANNQWAAAAAPPPAAPNNAWAAAPAPPPAQGGWAQPPQPPAPVAQPAPAYDQFGAGGGGGGPFQPGAPAPRPSFAHAGSVASLGGAPPPATPVAADPFAAPPSFAAPAQPPAVDPMAAYGQPAPPAQAPVQPPMQAPVQAPAAAGPFSPQPPAAAEPAPAAAPVANGGSNVALTMGSLTTDGLLAGSGGPGKDASADNALQNLMGSIDAFGITGAAAKPPAASNPFDSSNIMSNATLGEIKSSKGGGEKKSVMNAPPPAAGAMVMASSQGGNWGGALGGGYGAQQQQQPQGGAPQYGMAGGYGQPPAPQMGGYGQQQPQQMGGYGQPQPQMGGAMMGQQPPMQQQPQQGYGAPQYGQQPPMQQPPMQQNQWGAPSY